MALGNSRTLNGGRDYQNAVLSVAQHRYKVRAEIKNGCIWLHPHDWKKGIELKAPGSTYNVNHKARRHWEATHPYTGDIVATGVSMTDLLGKAVNAAFSVH